MSQLPDLAQLPQLLLPWYAANRRDLPWREDREPYHVWLSEIMLQQTRVEAVRGYYTRFLAALPNLQALATCPEEQLLKLWEGLGYYSRVRNLQRAAQMILAEFQGQFPCTHAEILRLPGVGAYTAGAIASICFGLPTPAVDGNVLRVVTRLCDCHAPVEKPQTKAAVTQALAALYPGQDAAALTQGLMELGALVCVPNGAPKCEACPLCPLCLGHARGTAQDLPVKAKKRPRRVEEWTVFVLEWEGAYAVEKRPRQGLLAGLWQLPNAPGLLEAEEALALAASWGVEPVQLRQCLNRRHIFTHVQWELRSYVLDCRTPAPAFHWAENHATDLALPTAFRVCLPVISEQ